MTAVLEGGRPAPIVTPLTPPKPSIGRRLFEHGQLHRTDFLAAGILALLTAITRIWNLAGYPRWFTDEGVYVSQAWAVEYQHHLAPYTYWYDHPPLGWVQVAIWGLLTGSWQRNSTASIMAGREFMVVMAVAAVVLTYVLARRLGIRRNFAIVAGLLYCLSPLAVSFSRYVLLDNIAVVWLLAAMVLVLSPKRRITAVFTGAACLAIAVLTKETVLLAVPAVVWMLWQNFRSARNWKTVRFVFFTITPIICGFYLLYAMVKNELLPGPGHVSLWQGVLFQLASRGGSGNIFNAQSDARLLIQNAWLGLDPWLPLLGVVTILPALMIPRLRGVAIALGLQVAILFKGGYLPYPFIITLLPFMALLVAGFGDALWPKLANWRSSGWRTALTTVGVGAYLAVSLGLAFGLVSTWPKTLQTEFTTNQTAQQTEAVSWVGSHLPKTATLVTEGELWLDIRRAGFDNPEVIWTYKIDTDPAVKAKYGSLAGLDYLVLDKSTFGIDGGVYPTLKTVIKGATTLATFGSDGPNQIVVLKVAHEATSGTTTPSVTNP